MNSSMKRNRSIGHESFDGAGSADNKRIKITSANEQQSVKNAKNTLDDEMDYIYTSDTNSDTNDATECQVSHEEPRSIFSLPAELRQIIIFDSFRGNDKKVYDPWSPRRLNSMIAEWVAVLTEVHPNLRRTSYTSKPSG